MISTSKITLARHETCLDMTSGGLALNYPNDVEKILFQIKLCSCGIALLNCTCSFRIMFVFLKLHSHLRIALMFVGLNLSWRSSI